MEGDKRRLQPVKIGMTSVETGRDRFLKDEYLSLPQISRWRNNLTALSQRYNLYFVAIEANILVYQPKFPFQNLERKQSLTIPPTLAEPTAQGYIDTRRSHTINHLIVGDLGSEEILLVATDSGNVAAYHTKAVRDTIKKKPYRYSTDARSDFVGLRAFFSHWVHESAWGLAIHKEARMIAVSANTPHYVTSADDHAKITVFAFALTGHSGVGENKCRSELEDSPEQSEWKTWVPNSAQIFQSDRGQNYRIVLSGHVHNVPSISFWNSKYDQDGTWLLSTDIGGRMKLWRIWGRQCWKTWDFASPISSADHLGDVVDRGWLVLALDPAAFRSADTLEEFSGWPRLVKYHKHTETAESFDITNCVRTQTPNTSQLHPAFGAMDDEADAEDDDSEMVGSDWGDDEIPDTEPGGVSLDSEESDGDISDDDEEAVEHGEVELEESVASARDENEQLTERLSAEEADQALDVLSTSGDDDQAEMLQSPSEDELDHFDDHSPPQGQDYMEDEGVEQRALESQMVSEASRNSVFNGSLNPELAVHLNHPKKRPRHSSSYKAVHEAHMAAKARRTAVPVEPIPTIPAIHCSAAHIRLLNVPANRTPHFFCGSALRQTLPHLMEANGYVHIDRLNMLQYIPELGIVIIATQLGRCAVCTLTKKPDTGTLGFRVDWILPTKQQEREGLRPSAAPLLGIATGPIQGREIREDLASSDEDSMSASDEAGKDRVFDRVFEPSFPDVGSSESEERSDSEHESEQSTRPEAHTGSKRARAAPSQNSKAYLGSHPQGARKHSAEARKHPKEGRSRPAKPIPRVEAWRGIENSRRYRLMLTYYDQTVMTYEIWREASEVGIDGCKNYRNRPSTLF